MEVLLTLSSEVCLSGTRAVKKQGPPEVLLTPQRSYARARPWIGTKSPVVPSLCSISSMLFLFLNHTDGQENLICLYVYLLLPILGLY
jgi:hypothetical protein